MRYFLTSFELARFRHSRLTRLAILIVLVLPTIYALAYLSANWDPVGNLHRVPAAIVNEDVSATSIQNGQSSTIDAGADLTRELTTAAAKSFNWTSTSRSAADAGLTSGKYAAELVIPSSFSSTLATVGTSDPHQAQLTVRTNDATNFITGSVATQLAASIQSSLSRSLSTRFLNQVFLNFGDLHTQLGQAASGANSLGAGAGQALSGADQLTSGAAALSSGATTARSGAADLSQGASTLSSGAASLNSGVDSYTKGADQAAVGAGQLSTGITSYTRGVDQLAAKGAQLQGAAGSLSQGSQSLSAGVTELSQGLGSAQAAADAHSEQLVPGAAALSQGLSALDVSLNSQHARDQLNQLVTGSGDLAGAVTKYTQGVGVLAAECAAEHTAADALCQQLSRLSTQENGPLASSATALAAGTSALSSSTAQLSGSVAQLDAGGKKLLAGSQQAAAGAQKLADPTTGAPALAKGASQLAASIGGTTDSASKQGSSPTVLGVLNDLSASSQSLRDGSGTLTRGLSTLSASSDSLRSGAGRVASGSGQLASAASALSTGVDSLAEGAEKLSTGAGSLASGLGTVDNGIKELASKLTGGANSVPAADASQSMTRATATADQVNATATRDNAVAGYGAGLAPYFLCIGLWVGGMVCYMLIRPISPRGMVSTAPSWRSAVAGWFPGVFAGTIGALVLWTFMHFVLGLHAAHPWGAVLFTALVGVVFASIHQALVAMFHAPGRLFALILLVLQLSAAGATYPIQTAGPFFEGLHTILPMTYAVAGLRRLIAGGPSGMVWVDVLVLAGFGALCLWLTLRACHSQRVWTLSRLHTALEM